jgi:hypothetical protein
VLDGAKALHAAAKRVWGRNGVIERCQVHKKQNVKVIVPEKHHGRRHAQALMRGGAAPGPEQVPPAQGPS